MINFDEGELRSILKDHGYIYDSKIGTGRYGQVYLVYSEKYSSPMALKIFENPGPNEKVCEEIEHIQKIFHPNIIRVYNFWVCGNFIFLIMQYCKNGSLEDYLKRNGPVHGSVLQMWSKQIIQAIAFCHSNGIAHSDLKPANILIDQHNRIQLADFGLSISANKGELINSFRGNPLTMSPEIIKRHQYDPFKSDIWSLGITLYALAANNYPWEITNKADIEKQIVGGFITYPLRMDKQFVEILKMMLKDNPSDRASLDEVLSHRYFEVKSAVSPIKKQPLSCCLSLAGRSVVSQKRRESDIVPPYVHTIFARHRTVNTL